MDKKGKKEIVVKALSFFITLIVLGLLILSGPAEAFSLSINVSETKPNLGESVSFIVSLDIEAGERLPVNDLRLEINGPVNINCKFLPNGTVILGCEKLIIEQISDANFTGGNLSGNYSGTIYNWGYGYGFGYGYGGFPESLKYNITLNTTDLDYGIYETFFKIKINGNQFSQQGENITIVEPINITDLPPVPLCAYETDNITLRANITGSIKEVWVETNISGNMTNHTTTQSSGIYSAVVNGVGGQNLEWRFVVKDIADDLTYGNWNSMYIIKRTKLTIAPLNPDGLNNWYVTEPLFTLENADANKIWYRWDSSGNLIYVSPFNLTNIPNPPPQSAGILRLTWWGNTTCGIEQEQNITIKVDLTNPLITNLQPANNSIVYNNLKPEISAYLDEVYQSNSGINKASVIMRLDENNVSINVFNADSLDAIVKHNPISDLNEGKHDVYVYVKDNAGRQSELAWFFYINTSIPQFNLTVFSPQAGIFNSKRVPFNITTTTRVEKIEYINHNDVRPRWKVLCRNCDEYGFDRGKTKTLNEGENNITIRATDGFSNTKEENIILFIDSKKPRISRTEPRRNSVVNGSEFYIKYTEDNLQNITLFYGTGTEFITKYDCPAGKNQECWFRNINLSAYNGQYIEYWFEVSDLVNVAESRKTRIKVDTSIPVLTVNSPINGGTYGRKIQFNITISEEVDLEYIDNSETRPRWRTLCTRCDEYGNNRAKTKSLKKGLHNIKIRAVDKAGNSDTEEISFNVNY